MIPTKSDMSQALEQRVGAEIQKKFSNAVVAVCGLGGLGSNVAISLARAGIGKLKLIDFDRIDVTNLNRQQYKACQIGLYKTDALAENLKEIAPYIDLELYNICIDKYNAEEILKEADVVCEAFDNAEAKSMLINIMSEKMSDKYYITASGMAGLDSGNLIKTRKITNKIYLCGDGINDVNDNIGLVSSRVMLCAAHEAHMILRILAGESEA